MSRSSNQQKQSVRPVAWRWLLICTAALGVIWAFMLLGQLNADQKLRDALRNQDLAALTLAIKQGANPNTDYLPQRTLSQVIRSRFVRFFGNQSSSGDEWVGVTMLMSAAGYRNTEAVRILLENGADPHKRDKERSTALHYASTRGDAKMIDLLLLAGANVHATDSHGVTPLLEATANNPSVEVVRVLVKAKSDINAVDDKGNSPLINAAARANAGAVSLLLAHGADPTHRNNQKDTALDWAKFHRKEHDDISVLEALSRTTHSDSGRGL